MSGPGDRASKTLSQCAPTLSSNADGHDGAPTRAGVERPCMPGSKSSASLQMSPAREPGDLAGVLSPMVGEGQPRKGQQP